MNATTQTQSAISAQDQANALLAASPAPTKTRREKLYIAYVAATAKIEELVVKSKELAEEINAIDALANVVAGAAIIVRVGKGDTAASVRGIILGVREEEDGSKTYNVQYGTGFDADIAVVKACKLSLPVQDEVVSEPTSSDEFLVDEATPAGN